MCADKDVAVRRKAVNKVRKLQGHCIPSTEDKELADIKPDDERPNIDEELLIPTDDEVNEDADATKKSRQNGAKTLQKVILPKLKFYATNYYDMIDRDTELKTQPPF